MPGHAEQEVAVDIRRCKRCERIVIHDDHIRGRALFQHAQFLLKVSARDLRIILEEHLRDLTPCRIGIAEVVLVQDVGHFPGFRHIVGIAVGPQTGQDPPVYQFHGRRASAGIAHVGFRIVYDHRLRLFDQLHFMRIDVNAVPEQRLLSQDPVIHEPVHDPFAVVLQAVMEILDPLRHMDVVSDLIGLIGRGQFHRFI